MFFGSILNSNPSIAVTPENVVVEKRFSRDAVTNPVAERQDYNVGTVRYPRIVPKDEECAKHLNKRTLTASDHTIPKELDLSA